MTTETRPRDVLQEDVLLGEHSLTSVSEKFSGVILTKKTPLVWFIGFGISFSVMMLLLLAVAWLLAFGVGVWGINVPVGWGFAIINFVWWIGIGHAGTLISAFLLLFRQEWRTSINRFAEAMTLFAVACAGLFPLLHMGRPWFFYWLLPYPNTMGLWPQFRSPLVWDVFAVSTYGTVSLIFWYVGLLPDLATMRDRAQNRIAQCVFGFFSLGWRNAARHWDRHQALYLILAGIATPLVVSVHSVVGMDFSVAIIPGWHSTIFPPYFVAGAIFSGFAMVMTITIPLRAVYKLREFVTMRHLDNMAKMMLATGLIVAYGYGIEAFMAYYSGDEFERYMMENRVTGPYWPAYWTLLACNIIAPQLFWFRRIRSNVVALFILSLIVNVGMWMERYVIVITSLHRDYLPSSWDMYYPTVWDWATYVGTIGMFFALMFLFVRFVPMISISEMRELIVERKKEHGHP